MEYILVIDDSEFMLEYTSDMLQQLGYRVKTTTSPAEFLRLAKTSLPIVALVDEIMPEIEGSKLVAATRAAGVTRLAVIFTSSVESPTPLEANTWRLPKPFGPTELDAAIRKVITSLG